MGPLFGAVRVAVQGASTQPKVHVQVYEAAKAAKTVLVLLDSDHADHNARVGMLRTFLHSTFL